MNLPPWTQVAIGTLTTFGLKLVGAIVVWLIGRRLIALAVRLTMSAVRRQSIDETLVTYIGSALSILLDVVLVVAILGFFGVETTTFAALLAGIGIPIGTAWGGILTNLAAGVFLVGLRPFRVGQFVTAGGVTGTIVEIGLLATVINTPDNVRTIVGNSKILADTIQNFSALDVRRVDRQAQLAGSVNPLDAIERFRRAVAAVPNVVTTPAPEVSLLDMNLNGPVIAIRPYTNNDHYWQVYFDTNEAIVRVAQEAGWPAPTPVQITRVVQA